MDERACLGGTLLAPVQNSEGEYVYQLRHASMSVRPHGTTRLPLEDFHEILYLSIFRNLPRKFKCH
jgi:hypothetical protein